MKTLSCLFAVLATLATSPGVSARPDAQSVREIADLITELDVKEARELLAHVDSDEPAVALERARLSLYVGDCDTASATLALLSGVKQAASLSELARTCARATAGSVVVEDAARGLWIRLQDGEDRALLPILSEVVVRARAAIERDLGVVMPRPLRIDLVRDLFSLSAVSGLPLEAAETTGTVAVARWGRVTIISPRATAGGFPWEDTLAHEITHLALTRATRDGAPLWLQEGLAKRQEIRWRDPRPFDGEPPADGVARDAMLSGESVGIDKLGPSIAMLPSADAASIAFAEVSSFVSYFAREMGQPALRLLFVDLKQLGTEHASDALRSVSGYDLDGWVRRWRAYLAALPQEGGEPQHDAAPGLTALLGAAQPLDAREQARRLRSADLLLRRGAPEPAAARLRPVLAGDPADASVRWRLGKTLLAGGHEGEAAPLFESVDGLDGPQAGWFALSGRFRRGRNEEPSAESAFDMAVSLNPYLEDAACEGRFRGPAPVDPGPAPGADLPDRPERRPLCEAARKIPSD